MKIDGNYDDFKESKKKVKKFVDDLKITEVETRDSFYNAVLLRGIFSKLSDDAQPARDVLGTSPKVPLKFLTPWTSTGPSGDSSRTSTKIVDLMKKKVFYRCNRPCFTHLLLFFTGEKNI